MIHVTIDAADAGSLAEQLMGIMKLICGTEITAAPQPEPVYVPKHADPVADITPADPDYQPKHAAKQTVKAEDVQKALAGMLKLKGKAKVKELLQRFGVDNFQLLDPDQYPEMMGAINAAK